jgi:DNA-binding XRE family transcriptional regulator
MMDSPTTFASRLKWWRERRGFSQLELAGVADVSQRHLSFLEVGRTSPSREIAPRHRAFRSACSSRMHPGANRTMPTLRAAATCA